MLGRLGRTAEPAAQGERSRRPPLLAGSYFAGARILRVVPPGIRHAAAAPGGAAWYWLSLAQRRAALDNYAAALGLERSDPQVARVARRAFQNYGRMLIDFRSDRRCSPVAISRVRGSCGSSRRASVTPRRRRAAPPGIGSAWRSGGRRSITTQPHWASSVRIHKLRVWPGVRFRTTAACSSTSDLTAAARR